MSREVGRIHTEICREHPERARILEHLPGINLTWNETRDPLYYYPEFHQWTAYFGFENKIAELGERLNNLPWSQTDELFCLKKFALYFTPYNREIDPPINLAEYENKYPLHSRFMHYFCPPVQSAVCLMKNRMVRGKAESLRYAHDIFPHPEIIDMIFEAVNRHYEIPDYYREPRLTEIEDGLFAYLKDVLRIISEETTLIDISPDDDSQILRRKLAPIGTGSMGRFFEGAKFCRMMMGRLLFYAEKIPHFDSTWLISHELKRIRRLFYETTFSAFGKIAWDADMTPDEVRDRCRGEFLDDSDYAAVKAYADIFSEEYTPGDIKRFAIRVAERMARFQVVLEKMAGAARKIAEKRS